MDWIGVVFRKIAVIVSISGDSLDWTKILYKNKSIADI